MNIHRASWKYLSSLVFSIYFEKIIKLFLIFEHKLQKFLTLKFRNCPASCMRVLSSAV